MKKEERIMDIGDVICVKKRMYYHYAIYIGEGKIVHLKSNNKKAPHRRYSVQKTGISEYIKNAKAYILPKEVFKGVYEGRAIQDRAMELVGSPGYNLLTNNCAHFVCLCLTGNRKFALLRCIVKRAFTAKLREYRTEAV